MDRGILTQSEREDDNRRMTGDDRIVGALRIHGTDGQVDIGGRIDSIVDTLLGSQRETVDSYVKVGPRDYLLYLRNPSEDEAQFEANLLSEDLRQRIAAASKLGPELRVKTIVLQLPALTLMNAVGSPGMLLDLIARTWDEKKAREQKEAEALRAAAETGELRRSRNGRDSITYVNQDIDNALSSMSPTEIDRLPFGVIKVTPKGTVLQFNAREAELTNLAPQRIIGRNFFRDIAPCTNRREFLGRFVEGVKSGKLDVTFNYLFDFRMKPRRVTVHLKKSYHDENFWILVEMDQPDARAKS
jgi:photoactive yellow protein